MRYPPRIISRLAVTVAVACAALMIVHTGCSSRSPEPIRDAREALGTVVSVTAYLRDENQTGDNTADAQGTRAIDAAYAEMAAVETVLDAHDPNSLIARIGKVGGQKLPKEALEILLAVERLGVSKEFSPYLFDVLALYDFEGTGNVPDPSEITAALSSRRLDFGGAAKGLALDRAANVLRGSSAIEAALLTAGSTTITFGAKPDGQPWRIGVEHPRLAGQTIATIEADGAVSVSTSGDYQRFFERDGVRYHHILNPQNGLPVRGLRSLTVVGDISGLDSDILSTALFVMGPEKAAAYARKQGLALVIVDAEGKTRIIPGPADATWRVSDKGP